MESLWIGMELNLSRGSKGDSSSPSEIAGGTVGEVVTALEGSWYCVRGDGDVIEGGGVVGS